MSRTILLLLFLLSGCATPSIPVDRNPVPFSQELTEEIATPEELAAQLVRDGMTTADGQRSLGRAIEAYGACYRSRVALIEAVKARGA